MAVSRHARIRILLLAIFGLLLSAPGASAEAPEVAQQYELGKQALDAGKPAEALGHFKTALSQADRSLGSTWQMLLAVALTYQELKQPANAAEMFRRFLEVTRSHDDLMTEKWRTRREVVRQELTALEQTLSETHAVVMVKSTPPGAGITVDGEPAGVDGDALTPTRLWLAPGEHTIALSLKGHEPVIQSFTTRAGQLDSFAPTLSPQAKQSPKSEQLPDAPTLSAELIVTSESEASIAPWIVMSGAGAALVLGGVFLGLAEGEAAVLDDIAAQGDPQALGAGSDAYDNWEAAKANLDTYDATAIAMFSIGGAAAIGGLVWWLLDDGDPVEANTAFHLLPTAQGLHGHLIWSF